MKRTRVHKASSTNNGTRCGKLHLRNVERYGSADSSQHTVPCCSSASIAWLLDSIAMQHLLAVPLRQRTCTAAAPGGHSLCCCMPVTRSSASGLMPASRSRQPSRCISCAEDTTAEQQQQQQQQRTNDGKLQQPPRSCLGYTICRAFSISAVEGCSSTAIGLLTPAQPLPQLR
jgi:hypothetical protein